MQTRGQSQYPDPDEQRFDEDDSDKALFEGKLPPAAHAIHRFEPVTCLG